MRQPKPWSDCGGCELYGLQCHCLCHVDNMAYGYHEIIYANGLADNMRELKGTPKIIKILTFGLINKKGERD